MKPWTTAAIVVATILFAAAVSNEFYNLTSPKSLSWHVFLRKAYSIAAFALVGYLALRAVRERGGRGSLLACAAGVGAYSAAIEVAQFLLGSKEGFGWNVFDVACGAVGGVLGTAAFRLQVRERHPR